MSQTAGSIKPGELFSVKGLVALVTGGGTGIGLMIARALADAGAERVYIAGRRMDVLQQATSAAAASPNRAGVIVPLCCDVTSKASLEGAVATVERDSGYLHLVVCNAGIAGPQVRPPVPGETSLEEWRQRQMEDVDGFTNTFRVNSSSVWFTAMAFLKLLDEGNRKRFDQGVSSQVVVISSIAGFNKHATGGYAYGPSKAAATHIAKMLSNVLPTWGIRANCVCPGLFPSEMAAPIVRRATGGGELRDVDDSTITLDTSIVPLGRMGDNRDMAGQILYLASRAGAYLNGNTIVVDGGRLGTFPSAGY